MPSVTIRAFGWGMRWGSDGTENQQAEHSEGGNPHHSRPSFGRWRFVSRHFGERRAVVAVHVQESRTAARDGFGFGPGSAAIAGSGNGFRRAPARRQWARSPRDA